MNAASSSASGTKAVSGRLLKEKQQVPHPGMSWEDTLNNLKVLDQWRQKINYQIKED